MMTGGSGSKIQMMQHQADAVLNQVAVQNTWYTVLDAKNTRIINIAWNETIANETIEVRLTVDGNVLAGSHAATAATWYYITWDAITAQTLQINSVVTIHVYKAFFLEGRSVKLEFRKTTNLGASAIVVVCKHAKIP